MSLQEVFKSPFNLVKSDFYDSPIQTLRFGFKTKDIEGETTMEEIYVLTKMYFDNIVERYKNYWQYEINPTESSFNLYVGIYRDYDITKIRVNRLAYDCEKDKIAVEDKYDENISKESKFFIGIDVSIYYVEEDFGNEEDEDDYEIKKAIKEDECIVCYENKPNILYTECLHCIVCDSCDKSGTFTKCPLCRSKIKNQRIKFF